MGDSKKKKLPTEIAAAKAKRKVFMTLLTVSFIIVAVLAFVAVPRLEAASEDVSTPVPGLVSMLLSLAGLFKVSTGVFLIGGGIAAFLGWAGGLDKFLPLLNLILGLFVVVVLGLTIYAYVIPSNWIPATG